MKQKNYWMIASTILLLILTSILIPSAVIAQGPQTDTLRALAIFEQVFRYIEKNYVDEVGAEVLLEGALNGLLDSLGDPHSAYLTGESLRDIGDTSTGQFGGIGIYINKEISSEEDKAAGKEEFIQVVAPIDDTPADRLGIRSNDLIIEIEGESTANMTSDDAVSKLRGRVGTKVNVRIRRGTRDFPVTINRAVIEIPTIRHALIPEHDIGYIRIIQFTPFTADRVKTAIEEFTAVGYNALIIDVRKNPGGLLRAVIDISDLFLDNGVIVGTSGRNAREEQIFNARTGTIVPLDIPIAVLIDGGSASASEIFAGALGDNRRATIIGEQSFGKGSVQQIRDAGNGAFRLTTSRYHTPNGTFIDKIGIVPNIIAEPEPLTDEQAADITTLLSQERIAGFVNGRTDIGQQEIARFIEQVMQSTSLDRNTIERLVRNEILRANNTQLVFDLEFDVVLQQAVAYLQSIQ